MTKKKVLRKILLVISWLVLAYLSIRFLLGDLDTSYMVLLTICYVSLFLNIVVTIPIYFKYKTFLDNYNYLKALHKARYKLYFSSDKEKIETYTQEIQHLGEALLSVGNHYIASGIFSEKKTQKVQEIIDKTKELMQKEFVIY